MKKIISLQLEEELFDLLKKEAKNNSSSVSSIIRKIIKQQLGEKENV